MKYIFRAFVFFILLFFIIAGYMYSLSLPFSASGEIREFAIQKGESFKYTCRRLENESFIRSALFLRFLSEHKEVTGRIKAGKYELSPSYSPAVILDMFLKGPEPDKGKLYTIKEGATQKEIFDTFAASIPVKSFEECFLKGREFLSEQGIHIEGSINNLEGFMFPDSYYLNENTTAADIVKKCLDNFVRHIPKNYQEICAARHYSLYDIVIMASIVQAEAARNDEMPVIASVFFNRLKKGISLESCATVQYALPQRKERLTYDDLKYDSPFNTYLIKGLPPSPICNPGAAAINAAFFPENTDYLYFVAKGDGTHHFSKTLAEHNRAKKQYIH